MDVHGYQGRPLAAPGHSPARPRRRLPLLRLLSPGLRGRDDMDLCGGGRRVNLRGGALAFAGHRRYSPPSLSWWWEKWSSRGGAPAGLLSALLAPPSAGGVCSVSVEQDLRRRTRDAAEELRLGGSELPAREEQGPGAGGAPGSGKRWRGAAVRAGRQRGSRGELCFRSDLGREGGLVLVACGGAGAGPAPPVMKEVLKSVGYEGNERLFFTSACRNPLQLHFLHSFPAVSF
jgi:hypothetical protein